MCNPEYDKMIDDTLSQLLETIRKYRTTGGDIHVLAAFKRLEEHVKWAQEGISDRNGCLDPNELEEKAMEAKYRIDLAAQVWNEIFDEFFGPPGDELC